MTPACGTGGGIAACVGSLASQLAAEHEVHVFASRYGRDPSDRLVFHHVPTLSGSWSVRRLSFFLASAVAVRRYRPALDVVHLHARSLARFPVVTCHGFPRAARDVVPRPGGGSVSARPGHFRRHRVLRPLLEYNYRPGRHRALIAVSRRLGDDLIRLCHSAPSTMHVIPNGVDTRRFHPGGRQIHREQLRRSLGVTERDFLCLFASFSFWLKGLHYLLEAAAHLPLARVLVVGEDRAYGERFQQLAVDLGLAERVRFVGAVPDLLPYYAAADALVLPTQYDSFGLVITEAMASGLPVVCTRAAGASELITDGIDGLLIDQASDVSAISERIRLLHEDGRFRTAMSGHARATAELYCWENIAQRTLEVYQEVTRQ